MASLKSYIVEKIRRLNQAIVLNQYTILLHQAFQNMHFTKSNRKMQRNEI